MDRVLKIRLGYWNEKEGYVVPRTRHPGAWEYIKNTLIASRVVDKTKDGRSIFVEDEHLVVRLDKENYEIEVLRVPRYPLHIRG